MQEIEIKILDIDRDEVIKKLVALGAEKVFDGLVRAKHYDYSDGRLRQGGELVRLRDFVEETAESDKGPGSGPGQRTGYVEFTYKGKKEIVDGMKVREEIENKVDDLDSVEKILFALNLEVTLDNEKRRIEYKLNNVKFDIDEYPGGVIYMEIEAISTDLINDMISKLGLDDNEKSSESFGEFFAKRYPDMDYLHFKF